MLSIQITKTKGKHLNNGCSTLLVNVNKKKTNIILFLFYLYIYPAELQESDRGAIMLGKQLIQFAFGNDNILLSD